MYKEQKIINKIFAIIVAIEMLSAVIAIAAIVQQQTLDDSGEAAGIENEQPIELAPGEKHDVYEVKETRQQATYVASTDAAEGYISEYELIELTEDIGEHYNICPELLQAICYKESGCYTLAENGNCKGLMQINISYMQQRADKLGINDYWSAYNNMLLAADYIAELRDETENGKDIYYVLMRYNMTTATANKLYEAGTYTDYAIDIAQHAAELERLHGK